MNFQSIQHTLRAAHRCDAAGLSVMDSPQLDHAAAIVSAGGALAAALEIFERLTATLENVMLHQSPAMTPEDARTRWQLVDEAKRTMEAGQLDAQACACLAAARIVRPADFPA